MVEKNTKPRVYTMKLSKIYPLYVTKAEKKGRTKLEVNEIFCWLTGYSHKELESKINENVDFENFIINAPRLNPLRSSIKGVVCGVRVEKMKQSVMKEIRYLDLLIDKLAKGKSMKEIFPEN